MDYSQNEYQSPQTGHAPGGFEIAAVVCGIASLLCCCTGIFGIAFGSLGILFAVLTRRTHHPMSTLTLVGLVLSCIGALLGLFLTVYSCVLLFTTPDFLQELDAMFRQMYGIGIEEYMELYL